MKINQIGYALVAALAAYYLIAWLLVGRTRSSGSVVVRYRPPENFSPAAIRFIYTMRVDGRTYTAILAQLAARGLLQIVPQNGSVILKQARRDYSAPKDLPDEEKAILKELFEWGEHVPLKRPDWRTVERLQETLQQQLGGKFVTRNMGWAVAGMVISGIVATWLSMASGLFSKDPVDAWVACTFAGLTVAIYGAFGYQMWDRNMLATKLALRGLYRRRTLPLLVAFVVIYPALWFVLIRSVAPVFAGVTEAMILMNTFLPSALRNHTAEGRRLRGEIEGFRQYLAGTEQDRLQRMNEPGKLVKIDPELIPYEIALDLREAWGDALGIQAMVETEL